MRSSYVLTFCLGAIVAMVFVIGIEFVRSNPSESLSPKQLSQKTPNTEKFSKKGVVTRVEKSAHGVTVVTVNTSSLESWNATVFHDFEDWNVGDECILIWVDYYESQSQRFAGCYFATKVGK